MRKNKHWIIAGSVLLCILGIVGVFGMYGIFRPGDDTNPPELDKDAVEWTDSQDADSSAGSSQDSISLPGMDVMKFKANQKKQLVNLYNPKQNNCYMKISLLLEDGTMLYQSGLISPGMGVYEIELTDGLPEGVYRNSVIKYECFTMDDDCNPLNGAELTSTIESISE